MTIVTQEIDDVFGDNYQDKLNTLSMCTCCERHMINRPRFFSHWFELPFSYLPDNTCQCNCRHVSRWICRQCPYEQETNTDVLR